MEQLLFFICFNNLLTFISPLGVNGAFKNLFIGRIFQIGIDIILVLLSLYINMEVLLLCKNQTQCSDFSYTQNENFCS